MQLVEKHIITKNKSIEDLCFKSARLYNYCLYTIKQQYLQTGKYEGEYKLSTRLAKEKQIDFNRLPASTAQQTIRMLFKNWKSFYRANEDFKINPSKYSGKPRIPKYKDKNGLFIAIFIKTQCRLKDGFVSFPEKSKLKPLKTKVKEIQQIRLIPKTTCFVVEIVYNKEKEINNELNKEKFLSIDLGLNNLATCVNNVGLQPFIINGKIIKSKNQLYNKKNAKLQSYVANSSSNKIKILTNYRNNFIEDKIHKISKYIVDYCDKNNIGTIIIGSNKEWKQSINLGKVNNQNFVSIPYQDLIHKITYKSDFIGIDVKLTEESYTSKIDHLVFEKMEHKEIYLGKRKKRGLFHSSTGKLINADINGAIGIARKVFSDSCVNEIIDSGLAFRPVRVNI